MATAQEWAATEGNAEVGTTTTMHNQKTPMRLLAGLLLLVALPLSSSVQAQNTFQIDFNANAGILANGGSASSVMNAVWNTQLALLMDFNSVALRVFNDSGSTENLTQLALTIGDDRFNFANFSENNSLVMRSDENFATASAVANDPQILTINDLTAFATTGGANPSQVAAGSDDADRIVIDFGNGGIEPGYSAVFELRFEFDDSVAVADRPTSEPLLGVSNSVFPQNFPSYQRILFDTDAPNPPFFADPIDLSDSSDNASVTASFSNGEQSPTVFVSDQIGVAPTSVVDPRHPAPNFITPQVNGNVIPEPASLALLMIGISGVASLRRRTS